MTRQLTTNPSTITRKLRAAGLSVSTTGGTPDRVDGDFTVYVLLADADKKAAARDQIIDLLGREGYTLTHRGDGLLTFGVPQPIVSIQPSSFVDNLWVDDATGESHEGTRLPYPFHARLSDGRVTRQDFWNGTPWRIVGFCNTPDPGRVDLYWHQIGEDPQAAVGKYVVTQDRNGSMAVHQTAVQSMVVTGVSA